METYVSTDVETDGPIPGPHSMLSFGSAAFAADGTLLATFEANLHTLPDAAGDPKTMAWWETQPEAWAACRRDLQEPAVAMAEYVAWVKGLPGRPVFVAYPAGFDFLFVYWYLMRFAGESPFSFSALDVKTFAMAVLGVRLPGGHEAEHAAAVVHRPPAHPQGPRRRARAGGVVLRDAGREPANRPLNWIVRPTPVGGLCAC